MINNYLEDRQMNERQKKFTAYLVKVLNPKDAKDFEEKVSQLTEEQLLEYYKQFLNMESSTIFAKLGAKLDYIKSLRGSCPEGYEVEKYMSGGCVKCKKKAAEGDKVVNIFKEACGGKSKRRITKKKNMGGTVSNAWSVPKDQKGSVVNRDDTVHTSRGVYNLSSKKLPYKKLDSASYRKLSDADKTKVDLKEEANGRAVSGAGATNPLMAKKKRNFKSK